MVRIMAGLAAWLAGTAIAVGIAWFGANVVVRDAGVGPGVPVINVAPTAPAPTPPTRNRSPAASPATASSTPPASPASPAAGRPTASPSRRSPATSAPAGSASPKPTPSPTTASTATSTPTSSAAGNVRSYTLAGGRVTLLVTADSASLVTAMPDAGFSVMTWSGTDWLRVDFSSGGQVSSLIASWYQHAPHRHPRKLNPCTPNAPRAPHPGGWRMVVAASRLLPARCQHRPPIGCCHHHRVRRQPSDGAAERGDADHRLGAPLRPPRATTLGLMAEQSRSTAELIVECLENEGVTHVFGIPGEENIRLVEALSKSLDRLRAHPPRAGRVVHGRDLRPPDRQGRRLLGHPRARCDQPAARRRRRDHELDPADRAVGPGRDEPQLQGVPPGRRPGLDVRAGDQVVGADGHARGGAGDDPQGVQAGPDRAARRRLPGGARGRRGGDRAAAARRRCGSTSRARTSRRPSRCDGPRRSSATARNPVVLAGHGAARAGAGDGADPLRRGAGRPGGDDLPRQGRVPRRPPARARRGRVHAPRLRQLRLRPRPT